MKGSSQDPPFFKPHSPHRVLGKLALIIAVSLIASLVVPGLVAYREGVFYPEAIKSKLEGNALARLEGYEARRKQLENQIQQIDSSLLTSSANTGQPTNVATLITLRNQFQQELNSLKPPIYLTGFYFNRLMLLWPVFYICLGLLTFLLPPSERRAESLLAQIKGTIPILLILIPMYRWPTWVRNAFFNSEGRVVYSYANFDVAPLSFIMQELQALGVAFLVALLWHQWLSFYSSRQRQLKVELAESNKNILREALDQFKLQRLSTTFFHWQVSSIFLALAFIGYTDFFWNYVIVIGDQRYIVHAIVMHAMWAVSWIIISLPLFITWYAWHTIRARAISALVLEPVPNNVSEEIALKALSELQPIGFLNLTASGIIAIVSFALPIIQAIYK